MDYEDVAEKLHEVAFEYNVQKMNFQRKEALSEDGDLAFDFSDANISDRSKFDAFITELCGCKLAENEKPCSCTIPKEEFIEFRNNYMKLTSSELDMVLLGTVPSAINCSDISVSGRIETVLKRTS